MTEDEDVDGNDSWLLLGEMVGDIGAVLTAGLYLARCWRVTDDGLYLAR